MSRSADLIVIGAAGFIGSAVAAEAKARGLEVIEVTRESYQPGLAARWLINANGNSKKFLAREQPALDFDLSVRSVMQSLHDFQYERYCFLSSIDVYDNVSDPAANRETAAIRRDRLSPYGLHKLIAEDLVRAYAPRRLILRMGGFVGPGLRKNSVYDLLKNLPLRVHPDSRYQYLHTRELAAIVLDLLAGAVEDDIWNVAGDGTLSLREIASWIPGAKLPEPVGFPEVYDVNIEKLKRWRAVPPTSETVRRFVADVLAGRETLA
ncbi:MAG: NAD(P)-dependent oxidoreductase [Kiritimatiellae bacterium]|nr:NAD(P)-dependent oxidoreductase [Kiritimatiellia bacterium]MDW8458807.1 NAD(P)-dependent oxidoreductase [Verrucomicrobiota bacterium]